MEFTWTPSWATVERSAPRNRSAELGPPQSVAIGSDGGNTDLKTWNVVLENRLHDEALAISAFLEARNGAEAFSWTNPRGKTRNYVCENWQPVVVADRNRGNVDTDKIWTITATFREVVDPGGFGGVVRGDVSLE
jgi:phage-related protein